MAQLGALSIGKGRDQILGQGLAPACPPQRVPDVPLLREDLKLYEAAPNQDGSPAWVIHDSVSNRFFRIGWLEFELLSRWHLANPALILVSLRRDTPLEVKVDDIKTVSDFLRQNDLVISATAEEVNRVVELDRKKNENWLVWLLHNYLFFRLPLVKPGRFLQSTYPGLSWVYSRFFAGVIAFATLLGLFLVIRQWDHFTHTFVDFLSLKGLFGFVIALVVAKCLHEFAHAYTATRYGVRVAHMGIAFLVMFPMLYTDTGESWKLTSRRERFNIAAAGVICELGLAGLATLAWALTEDGAIRSAFFFLATASWIMTLSINASPFMRFDGYFLLSDALDMPNLHQRAGAFARIWIRRRLLAWDIDWPEPATVFQRRALIGFALFTWLYRLVLFLGIAVAVYVFFFKALGILLFVVEIIWFIVRPVWSEVKVWVKEPERTSWKVRIVWLLTLLGVLLILFIPWRSDIRAPGYIRSENQSLIFSPLPARLVELRAPGAVKAGEAIAILDSPDARSRAVLSATGARTLALQLDQTVGRTDGVDSRAVLQEQMKERLAEVAAERSELDRLVIRAPFDGQLLDADRLMAPGVWVSANQSIGIVVDPQRWIAEVMVEQRDLEHLVVGNAVRFYIRGNPGTPINGRVSAVDRTRASYLPHSMLATEHGGEIAAVRGATDTAVAADAKSSGLVPRDSLYRVRIELQQSKLATQLMAGTAVIEGEARSIGGAWLKGALAVLIRESGF